MCEIGNEALQHIIKDSSVSRITIDSWNQVYIERAKNGTIAKIENVFSSFEQFLSFLGNLKENREISFQSENNKGTFEIEYEKGIKIMILEYPSERTRAFVTKSNRH